MRAAVTFLFVLYVVEAVGMMAAAIPFIRRRVKPNLWSGFRISETLRDEATWYRVNAQFGKWLFVAGAIFALAAVALYFTPGVGSDIVAYSLTCTGALFVALGGATWAGFRAIKA